MNPEGRTSNFNALNVNLTRQSGKCPNSWMQNDAGQFTLEAARK